jgi:hypothetical protein
MAIKAYTQLKGISSIGETLLMSEIESNVKSFLDWTLLHSAGAWTDVHIPQSGVNGGNFQTLRPVFDPSYDDGQVWETIRSDWVYETGVNYDTGLNPIDISGVYVGGTFYEEDDVTYAHHYNYPLGRVVFDSPIATGSAVTMEYSFRQVQVSKADESPLFREIQYGTLRPDDSQWTSRDDRGEWSRLGVQRSQMPQVVIEAVPRRIQKPYEMGNGSLIVYQDILLHVLSQDRWWRNQLIDIICLQDCKTIWMYNSDEVVSSGAAPLDHRGMRIDGLNMYPNLVNDRGIGYRWKTMRMTDINCSDVVTTNPHFHMGTVRMTIEVIYGDI